MAARLSRSETYRPMAHLRRFFESVRRTITAEPRPSAFCSTACWDDASTLKSKVSVGSPDLWNPVLPEKDEARSVHVGQLVAAEAFQLSNDSFVVRRVEREEMQTRQVAEGETEGPGGLFPQSVQEPSIGLRNNGQ
jgi:hypothetical protein